MKKCSRCGTEDKHFQPYRVRQGVIWLCVRCACFRPSDADAIALPYTHAVYRPGLNVYISLSLLEKHPLSPCAGFIVRTCVGHYYPLLEAYGGPSHETMVPVLSPNGEECLVEQEYVFVD